MIPSSPADHSRPGPDRGIPDRQCPACGEDRLTEFDGVTLRWHCNVCSETWRNRPGRHVPVRPAQRPLPGTLPPLEFDTSEFPPLPDSKK